MQPGRLRLRAYNVGFGDCLLMRFDYASGPTRTMLVDFGSTARAKSVGAQPAGRSLKQVAQQVARDCPDGLDVVAATHRHADHIAGFAGSAGAIIAGLSPEVVLMPWTEHPDLAVDATAPAAAPPGGARGVAARLQGMQDIAAAVLEVVDRRAAGGDESDDLRRLRFLGEVNLGNADAVRALHGLGRRTAYVSAGERDVVADALPGVRVDVLGPPTLEQVPDLASAADADRDEFWHLTAGGLAADGPRRGKRVFPDAPTARTVPQHARWLIPRIDRLRTEELFSLVRVIDDALNNTSLVLLVTVGETSVLLGGDAQLENWRWALDGAPDAAEVVARLARCRVYKVAHHGSLNATPRTLLWRHLSGRPAGELTTILSTRDDKHGEVERNSEVPRSTLVTALREHGELVDTRTATDPAEFWVDTELVL